MVDLSRRNTLRIIAVTGISGIAGCTSESNSASPSPTDSPTSSNSPTPTIAPIPAEKITEYESLTETGQELFQILLSKGSVERPVDEIPTKLWEAEYVRYEDKVYSVSKTDTDRNIGEYTLDITSVDESEVDESELVTYKDLSEGAKEAFNQALNEGEYTARGGTLPGKLDEARYVKYDRDYYKLIVAVGDIRIWEIGIEMVRG